MKQQSFTKEYLEDYYEKLFFDNLSHYYVTKDDGGINRVVDSKPLSYATMFTKNDEDRALFIALTTFMLCAEESLVSKVSEEDTNEVYKCLNAFGYPVVQPTSKYLDCLLNEYAFYEGVEAVREALKIVVPFMFGKFTPHLVTWNNGFFAKIDNLNLEIEETIYHSIMDKCLSLYSKLFENTRILIGGMLAERDIREYYTEDFIYQFKRIFPRAEDKGTYLSVLEVYPSKDGRLPYNMPWRNTMEPFMFASMMTYMVMAQQCILYLTNEKVSEDFHKCIGWPMISSGPSGDKYLHPLYMLEYAQLLPPKSESLFFNEVVKQIFSYLRVEMNKLLNGQESVMKDKEAGARFLDAIRGKGHICPKIKEYLDTQEKSIQELLVDWASSPHLDWHSELASFDIPLIKYPDYWGK